MSPAGCVGALVVFQRADEILNGATAFIKTFQSPFAKGIDR
jgi:hypothetical protein